MPKLTNGDVSETTNPIMSKVELRSGATITVRAWSVIILEQI